MAKLAHALVAAALLVGVVAAQSRPISLSTEIYIVSVGSRSDGTLEELFSPATEAEQGQVIEYRIFATNIGATTLPAGSVQIYGPVEDGMEYVSGSATPTSDRVLAEFSLDGAEFGTPPLLVGTGGAHRVAEPEEYKMIRWRLLVDLEPGERQEVGRYRVVLLPYNILPAASSGSFAATSTGNFEVLSFSYRWEGNYLYVVGEVRNAGRSAAGVELQAVARDASGRLVDSVNFWPASINNVSPGERYGFRYPVTQQRNAVTVEVRVVSTYEW